MPGAPAPPGAAAGDSPSPLSWRSVWGQISGVEASVRAVVRLGSLLRMTQSMGNPKTQQVQLWPSCQQRWASGGHRAEDRELQHVQMVAGDALPRTLCLGLAK